MNPTSRRFDRGGEQVAGIAAFRNRALAVLLASLAIAVLVACDLGGGQDPGQDTRSPEPAPAIDQPEFQIGEIAHRNLAGEDGLIEVEFEIQIANSGGAGAGEVAVGLDGQDPEAVSGLDGLAAGSSTVVAFTRQLAPGPHQLTVVAGAARTTHEFAVRASDLQLTSIGQPEIGADRVGFRLLLENVGDDPADGITLTATWSPSGDAGDRGELEVPLDFAFLAPGDDSQISFEAQIPAGEYQLALSADSASIDADLSNNRIEFGFGFDYVGIATSVESVAADDWTRSGEGIATIEVAIANVGLVPSGPTQFGVNCPAELGPDCGLRRELPAIPVGGSHAETLSLNLPAGTHVVRVFAGADEDGHRWGPENAVDLELVIPPQPPTKLIAQSEWSLKGFRSSGEAVVEINHRIRNAGSDPVQDPVTVTVTCRREEIEIPDCGSEFAVELPDGFGPTESTWELQVPPGVELRGTPGAQFGDQAGLLVPPKIAGLERYVWDCYRSRFESGAAGCSGWLFPTVTKWPHGEPVRYWTTGDPGYIALFEDLVAQSSDWLNLEFEPTQSRDDARFLAFMGSSKAAAADQRWDSCLGRDGCASFESADGAITSAAIGIWHQGDLSNAEVRNNVQTALWRDFLHAATGIKIRRELDQVLGDRPAVSPLESELLRLNSHPLVEPGMEMADVLDLIVFGEQLLDPPAPSDFGVAFTAIHSAIEELIRTGSARFSLSSQAAGACISGNYGPAVYEIGDLDDALNAINQFGIPGFVRFTSGSQDFVLDRGAYAFQRSGDRWLQTDFQDVHRATSWWEGQSGLFSLLGAVLKMADPEDLTVTFEPGGQITIRSVIAIDILARTMTISIDSETNQIQRFANQINVYGGCQSLSVATLTEYGPDLIDYAALR